MPEAQAGRSWSPPAGTLGELVRSAVHRADLLERDLELWQERALAAAPAPSLRGALDQHTVGVLAEVKRSSPSRGEINGRLDAAVQALEYEAGGAAAISVLTEPERFGGCIQDLARAAAAVHVPILRKDFHIAPVQLLEARALGASAALLIVRALPPDRLEELMVAAAEIGLELVLEVRDSGELEVALAAGAEIIGVNNRNLETLVIDPGTAPRVLPLVPPTVIAIAESGMSSREDVERAARAGADAVLVGSAVSAAREPRCAVELLAGVLRTGRGKHRSGTPYGS